jgi:hypothetical protein
LRFTPVRRNGLSRDCPGWAILRQFPVMLTLLDKVIEQQVLFAAAH